MEKLKKKKQYLLLGHVGAARDEILQAGKSALRILLSYDELGPYMDCFSLQLQRK